MEHTLRNLKRLIQNHGTTDNIIILQAFSYIKQMETEIMEENKKAWIDFMRDGCQKCYGASYAYKTVLGDREF